MKISDEKLLIEDEFFLFYEMMMQALKTDDVVDGLNKSLYLLKVFLLSGPVVLHKKNENGIYVYDICDSTMTKSTKPITDFVNKCSSLTEIRQIFSLDLNVSEYFDNLMLIYLKTHDNDYILSINNLDKTKVNGKFLERLRETMEIILKRAESYEKNIKAITIDLLTGLNNRNSYEMRINSLNNVDSELVYGLFDLFRLKFLNDNYSHAVGDIYIKETARILSKYWPSKKTKIMNEKELMVDTGHNIYRIGGDEFVLISDNEPLELTKVKAGLAAEEVSMINLGIEDKVPLGLNQGIVLHSPGYQIKKAYKEADALLSTDKKNMYLKYGLDRRH